MKKTLLALAITALSANAFAINLDDKTGSDIFAKEIKVAAAGTSIGNDNLVATVKAGFAISSAYVRFDLNNGATFAQEPSLTVAGMDTISPASGGKGSSFVIFNVTDTTGAEIAKDAVVTLTTGAETSLGAANGGINVINKDAVSVTYGLYETAGAALAQTGNLNPNKSGTLLSFANAVAVTAEKAASVTNIDAVNAESKLFTSGVSTDLVDLNVTLKTYGTAPAAPLNITGESAVTLTDIIKDTEWNVVGNFSAVAVDGLTATDDATIAEDKQSVKLAQIGGVTTTQTLAYEVTGESEIAETSISATFTPVAQTGYEIGATTANDVVKLEKNGKTEYVDLALKPGGTYENFVRISNTDTISGAFFIKVINDAGESASFPLSDVAGQPATLAAGASTTQMTIKEVFEAAAAKGLALSGQGKLRLEVTGQTNGVSVQTYTVSKDGNSFATF